MKTFIPAPFFEDSVVVSRAQHRADLRIGPAVIHEQFASMVEERLQIGIAGVHHSVVGFSFAHVGISRILKRMQCTPSYEFGAISANIWSRFMEFVCLFARRKEIFR